MGGTVFRSKLNRRVLGILLLMYVGYLGFFVYRRVYLVKETKTVRGVTILYKGPPFKFEWYSDTTMCPELECHVVSGTEHGYEDIEPDLVMMSGASFKEAEEFLAHYYGHHSRRNDEHFEHFEHSQYSVSVSKDRLNTGIPPLVIVNQEEYNSGLVTLHANAPLNLTDKVGVWMDHRIPEQALYVPSGAAFVFWAWIPRCRPLAYPVDPDGKAFYSPQVFIDLKTQYWGKGLGSVSLASMFVSNHATARDKIALDFMNATKIASFGQLYRNQFPKKEKDAWKSQKEGISLRESYATKVKLAKNYPFSLVLENVIAPRWTTEKLFHILKAGVIPVYYGSSPFHMLPCQGRCIIHMSDYGNNATKVVELMEYLVRNQTAYDSYFSWKKRPFRKEFLAMEDYCLANHHFSPACMSCERMHVLREKKNARAAKKKFTFSVHEFSNTFVPRQNASAYGIDLQLRSRSAYLKEPFWEGPIQI